MKTGRPRKYKSWRMTRNIFYDKAYEYMLKRIEEIDENRTTIFINSNKLKEIEKKLTIIWYINIIQVNQTLMDFL